MSPVPPGVPHKPRRPSSAMVAMKRNRAGGLLAGLPLYGLVGLGVLGNVLVPLLGR